MVPWLRLHVSTVGAQVWTLVEISQATQSKKKKKLYYEMNFNMGGGCIYFKIPELGDDNLLKVSLHENESFCLNSLLELEKEANIFFFFFQNPV